MSQKSDNKKDLVTLFFDAFFDSVSLALKSGDPVLISFIREEMFLVLMDLNLGVLSFSKVEIIYLRIKNTSKTIEIVSNFYNFDTEQYLKTQRSLLLFLKSLNQSNIQTVDNQIINGVKEINEKNKIIDRGDINPKIDPAINGLKKELFNFIKTNGESPNMMIFEKFSKFNRRSIKRHLSDLINSRLISRRSQGKKVYYMMTSNGDSNK